MATYRKRPASGVLYVNGQPTVVFDTVCTKEKRRWLLDQKLHSALLKVWREQTTAWRVGRYVIVPDHIHYFAWATEVEIEFEDWVKFWKSMFKREHGKARLKLQSNSWDTRMRTESQYEEKWDYCRQNPVRAGLVNDSNQWEFQGTVNDFRW